MDPGAPRAAGGDPAFFDDDYRRVLAPFQTEEEARAEVAALRDLLGLAQDDHIIDVGCGWGRHTRLLHDAGHDITGLDLSAPLLRMMPAPLPRVAGDMLDLPFADEACDVVLNLATSLGLFLEDGRALTALREMRRVLRPGGRLLLEGMNADDVVANYAERDAWTLEDGTEVRVRRRLDRDRAVSHEVMRWSGPNGAGEKRHSLRLRAADEMTALVEAAGLTHAGMWGGWDLEEPGPAAERLIVMARR